MLNQTALNFFLAILALGWTATIVGAVLEMWWNRIPLSRFGRFFTKGQH